MRVYDFEKKSKLLLPNYFNLKKEIERRFTRIKLIKADVFYLNTDLFRILIPPKAVSDFNTLQIISVYRYINPSLNPLYQRKSAFYSLKKHEVIL